MQGLNSLEEHLISRITPFMKLVVLPRGRQRAIRGQVCTFHGGKKRLICSNTMKPPAMAVFIARESDLKVLNAQHEAFAEEVQRAVQQLQAVQDGLLLYTRFKVCH